LSSEENEDEEDIAMSSSPGFDAEPRTPAAAASRRMGA
jgi:hypothetical protein